VSEWVDKWVRMRDGEVSFAMAQQHQLTPTMRSGALDSLISLTLTHFSTLPTHAHSLTYPPAPTQTQPPLLMYWLTWPLIIVSSIIVSKSAASTKVAEVVF
jgi:hypothetical protein